MRRTLKLIYILVILILLITTFFMLWDGSLLWEGLIIGGVALASILTSLTPYFYSLKLIEKYESNPIEQKHFRIWGIVLYFFCFPVKIYIFYINIDLFLNGGPGWAFG